jgi:hypothetical protein
MAVDVGLKLAFGFVVDYGNIFGLDVHFS